MRRGMIILFWTWLLIWSCSLLYTTEADTSTVTDSNVPLPKVILFCFAGRRDMMEEYHIWDVAWTNDDDEFIRDLSRAHPKIRVMYTPIMKITERATANSSLQIGFIYQFYFHSIFSDYVFVKVDDDVIFIDIPYFKSFIEHRVLDQDSFLLTANVVNNDKSKWDQMFVIHSDFLSNFPIRLMNHRVNKSVVTFPQDRRLSINFVSFLGKDLIHINQEFSNGLGWDDEYRLYHTIPMKLNRTNKMDGKLTVVHLSYGGNRTVYNEEALTEIINYYHQLADQFLGFNSKVEL